MPKIIPQRQILLVEDQQIIREGLRALISNMPGFEVVGEAENGFEAIKAFKNYAPDIVLMDLSMPKMNGVEATKHLKRINQDASILVLTSHCAEKCVRESLAAGASGFLDKNCSASELAQAINHICLGEIYISPRITDVMVKDYLDDNRALPKSTWDTLTARERQILKLVAEGARNRDIAGHLFICEKTVEKHRANMMKKLDLHSVPAFTAYCIQRGFVNVESIGY
jgi:DNA-binding NarL/FixJ family response regulator